MKDLNKVKPTEIKEFRKGQTEKLDKYKEEKGVTLTLGEYIRDILGVRITKTTSVITLYTVGEPLRGLEGGNHANTCEEWCLHLKTLEASMRKAYTEHRGGVAPLALKNGDKYSIHWLDDNFLTHAKEAHKRYEGV